jgi:hypothetical protein
VCQVCLTVQLRASLLSVQQAPTSAASLSFRPPSIKAWSCWDFIICMTSAWELARSAKRPSASSPSCVSRACVWSAHGAATHTARIVAWRSMCGTTASSCRHTRTPVAEASASVSGACACNQAVVHAIGCFAHCHGWRELVHQGMHAPEALRRNHAVCKHVLCDLSAADLSAGRGRGGATQRGAGGKNMERGQSYQPCKPACPKQQLREDSLLTMRLCSWAKRSPCSSSRKARTQAPVVSSWQPHLLRCRACRDEPRGCVHAGQHRLAVCVAAGSRSSGSGGQPPDDSNGGQDGPGDGNRDDQPWRRYPSWLKVR